MAKTYRIPKPKLDRLKKILDFYDDLSLECDGFTRVASYVLDYLGIPYVAFAGEAHVGDNVANKCHHVRYHCWIEIQDQANTIVDYRLRMWTHPGAPHGVFCVTDSQSVRYIRHKQLQLAVSTTIFNILTGKPLMAKEKKTKTPASGLTTESLRASISELQDLVDTLTTKLNERKEDVLRLEKLLEERSIVNSDELRVSIDRLRARLDALEGRDAKAEVRNIAMQYLVDTLDDDSFWQRFIAALARYQAPKIEGKTTGE